jgi:hypothetical protein
MKHDFIAADDRLLLEQAGLADFDALWKLELARVDEPNVGRGGWSSVCRLELPGRRYYLKRQSNHLTRSLAHPFGEPTFLREFRNIRRYEAHSVPAAQAAFFGMRVREGKPCAVLLTRALDDWRDLASWLSEWPRCPESQRRQILSACGLLVRRLHLAGLTHRCLYPRHIFVRENNTPPPPANHLSHLLVHDRERHFTACLIDLEKTHPLWFPRRDRIKELEQFIRHAPQLDDDEVDLFLATYLETPPRSPQTTQWRQWLAARRQHKAAD